MRIRSLTARVLLLASIWATIAIVSIALVISTLYRRAGERGYGDLLQAHLNGVINAVSMDEEGRLTGTPQLGPLAFSQPDSGWYWIVDPLLPTGGQRLASVSIGTAELPIASKEEFPFNDRYLRSYPASDAFGNILEVVETEVELTNGTARFRVTGNREVLEGDVRAFNNRLFLALGLFGIGSLIINALAILIGLRPLDHARRALGRVRAGEADRLTGEFPREIAPLADEVNELIEMNARVVERSRMQVGNLAHSLKTPIAVLLNESRDMGAKHSGLVQAQAKSMQSQVQAYLDRARIAAQRGSVLARTDVEGAVARMVRVMAKLNPNVDFVMDMAPPGAKLAVEQQDFEEVLGNLLENAARFAKSTVVVRVAPSSPPAQSSRDGHWLLVEVSDDGPGLDEHERSEALKRGRRLDETRPGTGLGLSIVNEIATEYEGSFELDRSKQGGLSARLVFPALFSEL